MYREVGCIERVSPMYLARIRIPGVRAAIHMSNASASIFDRAPPVDALLHRRQQRVQASRLIRIPLTPSVLRHRCHQACDDSDSADET